MYKTASANAQSRAVRTVLNAARAEIDASAFAGGLEARRQELVAEKKLLEVDIAELAGKIRHAKQLAWESGAYTPAKTYKAWEVSIHDKRRRAGRLDIELGEIKARFAVDATSSGPVMSYERAFVDMAMRLLADDVYRRIQNAAHQHMFEAARAVSAEAAE